MWNRDRRTLGRLAPCACCGEGGVKPGSGRCPRRQFLGKKTEEGRD